MTTFIATLRRVTVTAGMLLLLNSTVCAAGAPTDQLKTTVDAILATLAKKDITRDARRAEITTLIRERFDFRTMSQLTLATNWKNMNDAQKDRFVELFSQLLQESYMGRIEAYTDEKISFVGEKLKNDKAQVDTRIATKTVEIPIDYKLVQSGDKWLVYDVVIEEVSLIRSYRNSYDEVVKKDGADGLFKKMEEKLVELRNAPPPTKS